MEEELYTRIEDYLDDSLDAAARAAFETELQADLDLAEALTQIREARARLALHWKQENANRALANTLQEIGRQHFISNNPKHSIAPPQMQLKRWWPAMAAAACLAGLLVWFLFAKREADLYAQYRHFPEASFTTRSASDPDQANGNAAEAAFNAGRYAEALPLIHGYLSTHPLNLEFRFFAGLSQLELGRLTEAEDTFRQILLTENTWSGEARWYLALTYLKGKKEAECMEILKQIPSDGAHYSEAQQLLGKME